MYSFEFETNERHGTFKGQWCGIISGVAPAFFVHQLYLYPLKENENSIKKNTYRTGREEIHISMCGILVILKISIIDHWLALIFYGVKEEEDNWIMTIRDITP